MKQPARVPSQLSESMHKRLNAYALAAGAAGVSVLALAQPAEAKIAYTPAYKKVLTNGGPAFLDLNHDGVNDFYLTNVLGGRSTTQFWVLKVVPGHGNQIFGGSNGGGYFVASDLSAGKAIGPNKQHFGAATIMYRMGLYYSHTIGSWGNVHDRFLGLRFLIKGKVHYGWARLNVSSVHGKSLTATLTGYAYETIPGKAIIAGRTKGPDEIENSADQLNPTALTVPALPSATLGMLATGAPGLSIWRRESQRSLP